MKLFGATLVALLAMATVASAQAQPGQPPAGARTQVAGVITEVNAQANQVSIKTEKGETLTVTTSERTQILHAQTGETDPKKWSKMALSEMAPGDEAMAIIRGTLDQKPLAASSLVIRTKADLSQMAQKELEDWRKRGTTGTVATIDAAAHTLTLKAGLKTLTVQSSEKTQYHRYALDSAKVSDAKVSTFGEIKVGDQVNALGDKTEDGATIKAESIFSGSFRQIAATIVSIDAGSGEMKVTDLATKKPIIIRISSNSIMKRLPEQLAQGLARRYQASARGGAPATGNAAPAGPGGGGMRGGGMRGGGGGGDIGTMVERLPAMPLSELKPKEAIMVSTTQGTDPTRVTAIMLLAGVEPILTAAPNATRDIMSGWNLGGGGGGEGN